MRAVKDAVEVELVNLVHIIARYKYAQNAGDTEVQDICDYISRLDALRERYRDKISFMSGQRTVWRVLRMHSQGDECEKQIRNLEARIRAMNGKKLVLLAKYRDRVYVYLNEMRKITQEVEVAEGLMKRVADKIAARFKPKKKRAKDVFLGTGFPGATLD